MRRKQYVGTAVRVKDGVRRRIATVRTFRGIGPGPSELPLSRNVGRLGDVDVHLFAEGTHAPRLRGLRRARRAPRRDARRRAGRRLRRLGAQRRQRPRHRRLRTAGASARRRSRAAARPASGRGSSPASATARATSTAIVSRHGGYRVDKADPYALPPRAAARDRVDRLGPRLRLGRRRLDGARGARATRSTRRCRSTRCTSGRGCASPRRSNRWLSYRELAPEAGRRTRGAAASRTSS